MILTRMHAEVAGAVLAVVIGGIAFVEHDNHVRVQAVADATQKAQDTFQKQLATQAAEIDAKLKQRDEQHAQETKSLQDEFAAAAKSEAQMVALLQKLTGAPQPFVVTTPAATKENPDPASVVTVPQADFPAIQKYAQQCEQCRLDRAKLAADVADREAQAALAQKEIDSLKTQRDTALVAAKGGTTLGRTVRVIKWLAIGGAIGYVAARH